MNTRPNRNDPAVVKAAVDKLLPSVVEWCKQAGYTRSWPIPDYSIEEDDIALIRNTLEAELDYEYNGYRLARALEQESFLEPDAALVEILDRAYAHVRSAHVEAVKAWVKEVTLSPPFSLSDKVSVPCHYCSGRRPPPGVSAYTGEVIGINTDQAMITVCIPELGHVREGCGTHGSIIPYEYATKL